MPVETPESIFLQQGILGAIIVVLGGVISFLAWRIDAKDKEIKELNESLLQLSEKRVADFKENGEKMIQTSTVMANTVQSLKETIASQTEAITKVLDRVRG